MLFNVQKSVHDMGFAFVAVVGTIEFSMVCAMHDTEFSNLIFPNSDYDSHVAK